MKLPIQQGNRERVAKTSEFVDQATQVLEGDILLAQQRFVTAMEARLATMPREQKERYFAVLSALVAKLEDPQKSLREILQEMFHETASLIFAELQGQG
ncbi:MAG: hypothetical protein N3C12_13385 [Candidatus Binatia bacterium]|nr:hypothetical protein [Candidatus Binatia bacterium]